MRENKQSYPSLNYEACLVPAMKPSLQFHAGVAQPNQNQKEPDLHPHCKPLEQMLDQQRAQIRSRHERGFEWHLQRRGTAPNNVIVDGTESCKAFANAPTQHSIVHQTTILGKFHELKHAHIHGKPPPQKNHQHTSGRPPREWVKEDHHA
jgi:hypothetical protein